MLFTHHLLLLFLFRLKISPTYISYHHHHHHQRTHKSYVVDKHFRHISFIQVGIKLLTTLHVRYDDAKDIKEYVMVTRRWEEEEKEEKISSYQHCQHEKGISFTRHKKVSQNRRRKIVSIVSVYVYGSRLLKNDNDKE